MRSRMPTVRKPQRWCERSDFEKLRVFQGFSLSGRADFPSANAASNQPKQRMGFRAHDPLEGPRQGRAPAAELGPQVPPLVIDLSDGLRKPRSGARPAELAAVEGKSAALGLGENVKEIAVDEGERVGPGLEAAKLGVMAIPARAAEKDLSSEKRFPPERCEAPGVEIPRMDRPESQ